MDNNLFHNYDCNIVACRVGSENRDLQEKWICIYVLLVLVVCSISDILGAIYTVIFHEIEAWINCGYAFLSLQLLT